MNRRVIVAVMAGMVLVAGTVVSLTHAQTAGADPAASQQVPPPAGGAPHANPMPGGPGGPHGPFSEPDQAMHMMMAMRQMQQFAFDPATAGFVAIGGLKDDARRKPDAIISDLEDQLAKAKSLGLRNAIRFTLKDLYKAQGDDEKVLGIDRALIAENDAALAKMPAPPERPEGR